MEIEGVVMDCELSTVCPGPAEADIAHFLKSMGLNLKDQHLKQTPRRVVRAWNEFFLSGYRQKPEEIINVEFSENNYNQMIIVRDIPFCSLCSHHLVPFIGRAKIGYIPKEGRITGLSKLARVVDMYARRLQIQERMTSQIAHAIQNCLDPVGVGVVLEAEHLCMTIRGVQKPGALTVTSHLLGAMLTEAEARAEFMTL